MTKERDVIPPLAASVNSLPEAVAISLQEGLGEKTLFSFARAIKAFEATTGFKLPSKDLLGAFGLWWNTAKPLLPSDADYDEWRFAFADALASAKTPLGSNALEEAIRRAESSPLPAEANRYASAKLQRLVAVCHHLQAITADGPFFLSVRSVQRITGAANLRVAASFLSGLTRDGLLIVAEPGKPGGKRATRFFFNRPGIRPKSATAGARAGEPQIRSRTGSASPASEGSSTKYFYIRAERIKALEKLLKDHPGEGQDQPRDSKERTDYRKLSKELETLRREQAGVSTS